MSPSKNKENAKNAFPWRIDEEKDNVRPQPQPGFDPSRFHSNTNKPGQQVVLQLHSKIRHERIAQGKREVIQEKELQRSAFRSVTVLKTWHTQQQALDHFSSLQQKFLGQVNKADDSKTKRIDEPKNNQAAASQESDSSEQTTATEGSQTMEAKRQQRDRSKSPAKSTRKQQYCEEFLKEHNLKGPLAVNLDTHNAMWSMEPRIWSIEKSSTGKRKYIVGHTGRLMDRYWRKIDRHQRHYYELIPAGQACRLYLDLEFAKANNTDLRGAEEELLSELLEDLSEELQRVYPHQVERPITRQDVVDLDATTDQKFSRHWIVHLPGGHLFRDTTAMGRFVQNWIGRLADLHVTRQLGIHRPLLQKHLFVNPAPSKATCPQTAVIASARPTCILDLGVYTRNRLFRLMGSNKYGKSTAAILRIADANEFPLVAQGDFGNHLFYSPAMENTKSNDQDIAKSPSKSNESPGKEFESAIEEAVKGFETCTDWTLHAEALAKTLVVPLNVSKMNFPILPCDDNESVDGADPRKVTTIGQPSRPFGARPFSATYFGPSPYPIIDDFVQRELATRKGIPGSIRAWSVETNIDNRPISIAYQINVNRWCECVQRAHKSNNIYWIVDLVLWHCVQRCFDPDCRSLSFRGTPVPLPDAIRETIQQEWIDEELARIDEATLLEAAVPTTVQAQIPPGQENIPEKDEFDVDSDFEAALMALNLGTPLKNQPPGQMSCTARAKSNDVSSNDVSIPIKTETKSTEDLSESALLEAIADNPDLFP